jgi:hypothetical protein
MPRGRKSEDLSTLQMALIGYQMEKQKIDVRIREIEARLGGKRIAASASASSAGAAAPAKTKGVKRVLSPEARKRIAAAQKKRWAEHRKKLAGGKPE